MQYKEKAPIAGCGGQQFLYLNGTGPCEYPFANVGALFSGPAWKVSNINVTYKTAVEIVR
jgi:hypothetical protein